MTPIGQTTHQISIIFNRLHEGTIADILTQEEDTPSKTVDAKGYTDRHTDVTNYTMGNYNYKQGGRPKMIETKEIHPKCF